MDDAERSEWERQIWIDAYGMPADLPEEQRQAFDRAITKTAGQEPLIVSSNWQRAMLKNAWSGRRSNRGRTWRLFFKFADLAFRQAVSLAKETRAKMSSTVGQFVGMCVRLDEFIRRFRAILNRPTLLKEWPDECPALRSLGRRERAPRRGAAISRTGLILLWPSRRVISFLEGPNWRRLSSIRNPTRGSSLGRKRPTRNCGRRRYRLCPSWPMHEILRDAASLTLKLRAEVFQQNASVRGKADDGAVGTRFRRP